MGGKTTPVPIDGDSAVWVGPTNPRVAYFGVTLADGTNVACGAGAVSTAEDLSDPMLTRNIERAPWSCVVP